MRNKARKWVLAALDDIATTMPFPILGVDTDNGSEFINVTCCMVRAAPDHLHPVAAGQQERRLPRRAEELGGRPHRGRLPPLRHRGRTVATQQDLALQSQLTNYFHPQQKLVSKVRTARRCPRNTTPRPPRITARPNTRSITVDHIAILAGTYRDQPRRHPTPDPGPDHPAPHPDHQQAPSSPRLHARTLG